jgi:3-oxoacyl-(acyl-carrier-protein) synthase
MSREAVVTGLGCVSPYGRGVERFWQGLCAGEQAFGPIRHFDAGPYRNAVAGVVPEGSVETGGARANAFLAAAAEEAVAMAGLTPEVPGAERLGAVTGTNFGAAQAGLEALRRRAADPERATDLTASRMGAGLAALRTVLPARGPATVLSLACASGTAAVGTALWWLRQGRADAVLAGGFDELSEHAYAGLSNLRAITKETIRPFDARRGGTLFAEGAGVLVLETPEHAAARGATVLARVLGRGLTNDAFHMTAPDKSGAGIVAVLRQALADAGVEPEEVVHFNCHGTGTKYNDLIETNAVKEVFGAHAAALVLTANKSAFGHAMGAAGALESIATVLAVRDGVVPPTVGLEEPDPELDLDYCPGAARELPVPVAVCNSYGFGGANASVVIAS